MSTLPEEKRKEWYDEGKKSYKATSSMLRANARNRLYDTEEKRNAIHDERERGEGMFLFDEKHRERLRTKWGYTEEMIEEARKAHGEGYAASRLWYKGADAKHRAILDSYRPIFEEAEKIAAGVDVSDIRDGFPCGSAHVYLGSSQRKEPLGKALAHFSSYSTPQYKYEIPIHLPSYGQCIRFYERICEAVEKSLRGNGIDAQVYSWID